MPHAPTPDAYRVFEAIAKELYGDLVHPGELWDIAKANDPSEVHIDSDIAGKKKKKKPAEQQDTHSNTARALVLGGAAETLGAVRAGQVALRAVRKPVAEAKAAAPKVKAAAKTAESFGSRAAKVGEFGLQATNLGVGLVAAHELASHAKKKKKAVAVAPKPYVAAKGLTVTVPRRRIKMTQAQRDTWMTARDGAARGGIKLLVGGALVGGAAAGHHLGVKRGMKNAAAPVEPAAPEPAKPAKVAKAFRVKPLNAAAAPRVITLKARRPAGSPPLAKSLTWTGQISKVDTDKHQVFGWCSLSKVDGQDVVDLQGDFIPLDEIEKSAYRYVIESRKGGDMHKRVSKNDAPLHTSDLIESFVVTPEKLAGMGLAEDALPHGWWVGFKVNDEEQWQLVKADKRTGFSIHGTGQRRAA